MPYPALSKMQRSPAQICKGAHGVWYVCDMCLAPPPQAAAKLTHVHAAGADGVHGRL